MKIISINGAIRSGCAVALSVCGLVFSGFTAAEQRISDIDFNALPDGRLSIGLDFQGVESREFSSYTIEEPARIVIDFPNTQSALSQRRFSLPEGNASSVVVLAAGDRSRLIVNLDNLGRFDTAFEGNRFTLEIQGDSAGSYTVPTLASSLDVPSNDTQSVRDAAISDLEFRRSAQGEGQLILSLSDANVDVNVFSEGSRISLELLDVDVSDALSRLYDVTDFATPVSQIEVAPSARGARVLLKANGFYDYLAYQQGDQYVVSVQPVTEAEREERLSEFSYVGDRISLNFQNIEVRAVLQLIADFTDLNLVASDTVSGNITLRLQNVPWDQAMELVLKTKGLDSRQIGNVLRVAPAAEIAERERQEIEANKQLAELAPLKSEFIQIRYAKAANVVTLFEAGSEQGGSLVSERGSVVVDERTNSIIVTDTTAKLDEIRALIANVDIPIRQVMIEARIVIASSDVDEQLGIRWGGGYIDSDVDSVLSVARNIEATNAINQAVIGGTVATAPTTPLVDLGIASSTSGFAVGFTSDDLFLSAELSALEAAGEGEVVSQPKVITGDKQQATIKSGTEIPYQEGAAAPSW